MKFFAGKPNAEKIFILLLFVSTSLLFSGCGPDGTDSVKNITVSEAKEFLSRPGIFILDVRTKEEHESGHIRGSILIPIDEIAERTSELPKEKNKNILVYCRSGGRSARVSQFLAHFGYTDVKNLKGGIIAWVNSGELLEK